MKSAWPWIWFGLAVLAIAVLVMLLVMLWRKAKELGRQLAEASDAFARMSEAIEAHTQALEPLPGNALARSKAEVREEWRHNSYRRRARTEEWALRRRVTYGRLADIAGLGSLEPLTAPSTGARVGAAQQVAPQRDHSAGTAAGTGPDQGLGRDGAAREGR